MSEAQPQAVVPAEWNQNDCDVAYRDLAADFGAADRRGNWPTIWRRAINVEIRKAEHAREGADLLTEKGRKYYFEQTERMKALRDLANPVSFLKKHLEPKDPPHA